MHGSGTSERRLQERLDTGLLVGSTDEEVLRSFLVLVRSWRDSPTEIPLRLRRTDAAVLVAILGTDRHAVERRLVASTSCTPRTARHCRRLLLASVGAVMLGITGVTVAVTLDASLQPVPDGGGTFTLAGDTPATSSVPPVDVTEPETSEDVVDTPTTGAPAALGPAPGVAVASASGGNIGSETALAVRQPISEAATPPSGAEAIVRVSSVGIDLPVIGGGQSVIDEGRVAHYTAQGWEPAVPPGAPGTYWLAAHRTTHGGPFAALPDIVVGAQVEVSTKDRTYVYTVTSIRVTDLWPGDEAVYGTDPTASTILLQTCIDSTHRLLVRGMLTPGTGT